MTDRRIKTTINANLVRRMQAGVAGQAALSVAPSESEHEATEARESESRRVGKGRPGPTPNRAATSRSGAEKRQSRTTFSVPTEIGEQLRRLTYALTLSDGMESSIGITVARALDLLEEELKSNGITVPSGPARIRSGPRMR